MVSRICARDFDDSTLFIVVLSFSLSLSLSLGEEDLPLHRKCKREKRGERWNVRGIDETALDKCTRDNWQRGTHARTLFSRVALGWLLIIRVTVPGKV